jgi:hypothetical protein
MRSQLFGFTIPIRYVYEADLKCSLNQAYEVTCQLTQQLGGIGSQGTNMESVPVLGGFYTRKVEAWFSEWDLETEQIANRVIREFGSHDELLRMERLQEALSWRWLKFRETAVIGQVPVLL